MNTYGCTKINVNYHWNNIRTNKKISMKVCFPLPLLSSPPLCLLYLKSNSYEDTCPTFLTPQRALHKKL